MKKGIAITLTIVTGLLILDSLDAGHAVMMFLLAGVIPGTSIELSASTMMEIFALLTGFLLARITRRIMLLAAQRPVQQNA